MRIDLGEAFHVGMVVADMEAARVDLAAALGLTFGVVEHRVIVLRYRGESITTPLSFTYSHQGPLHLELIGVAPGTPWEEPNRTHHVAYWVDDLQESVAELTSCGMEMEVTYDHPSGDPEGFAYLTGPAGHRIELVEARRREVMENWIRGDQTFPDVPGN